MQLLPVVDGHTAAGYRNLWVQPRIDGLGDDVFGKTNNYGAGPAGGCCEHGFGNEFRGAFGVVEDPHAVSSGSEPSVWIKFLEGFFFAVFEWDEADEQHHCC